jgi:hypothetical protein
MKDNDYRSLLKYAWLTKKWHLLCVFFIFIALIVSVRPWKPTPDCIWWEWVEPVTGMTTLVVAIFVWINELTQDWENSLPKRLTVNFFYKGEKKMACERAYLAGEGDIRAWGQQLGGQMSGNPQLRFEPSIVQTIGKRDYDEVTGERIKLYTVDFNLTEFPPAFTRDNSVVVNAEEVSDFAKGKKIRWYYDDQKKQFSKVWLGPNESFPG